MGYKPRKKIFGSKEAMIKQPTLKLEIWCIPNKKNYDDKRKTQYPTSAPKSKRFFYIIQIRSEQNKMAFSHKAQANQAM